MTIVAPDKQRIQHTLITFNFKTLFVEELGWDILREAPLTITVDGQSYILRPLVEKRGFKVYTCTQDTANVLTSTTMRQIERELTTHAYEHLIIYTDAACTQQLWQWVKREPGQPSATHLYRLHKGQSGELLAQKLLSLAFSIEEEEQLGTTAVAARVRQALDAERVTKKFYERFQKEHATFLDFIEGIVEQADREWYASLMLNRLMFVYFIQKKGLLDTTRRDALDGDPHYLTHKLREMQGRYGEDQFYSFYRYFLLKLFHDGLGQGDRSPELVQLLGNIPYLNGGLFDVHLLERDYPTIRIADEAFERIFAFFDEFDWHLDDRPLRNDREINPDVLGYIFEKYINQKQMGAYYTKEDITEYIAKNAIIPRLLEATQQQCSIAFIPDGFVWSLLRRDPERYLYDALKKGSDLPIPPEIARGLRDVSQRSEWNTLAPATYALPTETWREVVARRMRFEEIRAKLISGEITAINDLVTYNLNILQFAQDVISYSEGPELLTAFYTALERITILDPTCGSGAFLFAALNILEPLYEACLDRMQEMVAERDRLDILEPQRRTIHPGVALTRFRDTLAQVAKHPNRRYFILKSIIVNNLYGVDFMEEAVEICKLRLFLRLVAQIDRFADIEPLPDIDFNIRAGNTLVGFATYTKAERTITSKLDFDNTMEQIRLKAQDVERSFALFRTMQTSLKIDPIDMATMKMQVRSQLSDLNAVLDRYLSAEYGIDRNNIKDDGEYSRRYAAWRKSHQPFHWFIEFYTIMQAGGFDVIIGNPPYVEYNKVRKDYAIKGYQTESCGNTYAFVVERTLELLQEVGKLGVIIPVASVCTDGYTVLQQVLEHAGNLIISNFNDRPSKLFDGLEHIRLSIILCNKTQNSQHTVYTTKYHKWQSDERSTLFDKMTLIDTTDFVQDGSIPKLGTPMEREILRKVLYQGKQLSLFVDKTGKHTIYYTRKLSNFVQILDFIPLIFDAAGHPREPSELKSITFSSKEVRDIFLALLNSSLFYWLLTIFSDCRNLNKRELYSTYFDVEHASHEIVELLSTLTDALMSDFKRHSKMLEMRYESLGKMTIQCIYPRYSKSIIDEIDRILAQHYGFTGQELDFIINYDIKYRMGRGDDGEDEGE